MKTVLVSGGTSTLGRAICTRFVADGYTVYCAYASSKEKATALSASLGPSLIPLHLDVQDQESIAQGCAHLQSLDLLVNNSGVFSVFPTEELGEAEWQRIFDVNVTGMFRLTKQVLPLLRQAKGNIINIASINALHPGFGGTTCYDASKGAVVSYTKALAAELAPEVRVNAVAPGLIAAPYLDNDHPLRQLYEKRALLSHLVEADQVAQVVSFLSGCCAMTAQVITVDCGYLAG